MQDEWRATANLTVNVGVRFDDVSAAITERHLSLRASAVWTVTDGPVFHVGYARYFLPPPREVEGEVAIEFARTTAAMSTEHGDALKSEIDDYFDAGVDWMLGHLTVGIDGYWRDARNLIAED